MKIRRRKERANGFYDGGMMSVRLESRLRLTIAALVSRLLRYSYRDRVSARYPGRHLAVPAGNGDHDRWFKDFRRRLASDSRRQQQVRSDEEMRQLGNRLATAMVQLIENSAGQRRIDRR